MADFLTNLWESVFTPGTTPTLLVATNATFAALQLLLAALLIATYSIHFAVLSVLCGGLWYSINWFATELQLAQAQQAAKDDEAKKAGKRKKDWRKDGEVGDSADDEGEDTEVEEVGGLRGSQGDGDIVSGGLESVKKESEEIVDATAGSGVLVGGSSSADAGVEQAIAGAEMRQRPSRVEELDRSGEVSTDSEWEKVSQDGDR